MRLLIQKKAEQIVAQKIVPTPGHLFIPPRKLGTLPPTALTDEEIAEILNENNISLEYYTDPLE